MQHAHLSADKAGNLISCTEGTYMLPCKSDWDLDTIPGTGSRFYSQA